MVRRKSNSPRRSSEKAKTSMNRKSTVNVGTKRFKVSVAILRDIRKLQLNTTFLIPKLAFARVVREIVQERTHGDNSYRIQSLALAALQEATEMYITHYFEDSYKCSFHGKRITLQPKDMQLVKIIRSRFENF